MIATDLAQSKRLKELGAPQDTTVMFHCAGSETGRETIMNHAQFQSVDGWFVICAAYTLGELIEWLGDDFLSLHREVMPDSIEDAWSCESLNYQVFGATPLDAVVALAEAVKGGR